MSNVIELLEEAAKSSRLDLSEFGRLHPNSSQYRDSIPYPTNEDEVTAFIKDRVGLHHSTWITNPIEEALKLLRGYGKPG